MCGLYTLDLKAKPIMALLRAKVKGKGIKVTIMRVLKGRRVE